MWEGAGDRTETAIFWPPLLWPSTLCLSHSLDPQPRGPAAQFSAGWWLSLLHLISIFSGPQLIGLSEGPFGRVWLSLPHLVYNSVRSLTATGTTTNLTSVLTELFNSSTPTQSPTRFLESRVGSSSSGNNCHKSLSSGASVYECTMGIFFNLVPFHQPISAHAISSHNCH